MRGQGTGFVNPFLIRSTEADGWRAGIDQPLDTQGPAGQQNILRADHVRFIIIPVITPDAGLGSHMKDRGAASGGFLDDGGIGEIPLKAAHAHRFKFRITAAIQGVNAVAACDQLLDEGFSKKAAPTGDKDFFRHCASAHDFNFSLNIFALCRMSTGKLSCVRKSLIFRVCS